MNNTSSPSDQTLFSRICHGRALVFLILFLALAWRLPAAIGPWAAGVVFDNYNPNWVWYLSGISCMVAIGIFLMLNRRVEQRIAVQDAGV